MVAHQPELIRIYGKYSMLSIRIVEIIVQEL